MLYKLQGESLIDHQHACYYSGITAAALFNTKMPGKDPVSPMDFVPKVADPAKERREKYKVNLFNGVCLMGDRLLLVPGKFELFRTATIQSMRDDGCADAEEIFAEVFEMHEQRKRDEELRKECSKKD